MKYQMQKFTTKIVDLMKAERLYESQGGPIIMSQVEKNVLLVIPLIESLALSCILYFIFYLVIGFSFLDLSGDVY